MNKQVTTKLLKLFKKVTDNSSDSRPILQYKFNDQLALPVSKNKLKFYGQGMEVDFQFRKEVP